MFAICAAIFLIVAGLLVFTIIRFRHRVGDEASEPPQIYGSNQIEMAWTVLPVLIVLVLILVTSRTVADIQNRKQPTNAVQATVIGHQWWWEIRYPELGIVTANELHVPAERAAQAPMCQRFSSCSRLMSCTALGATTAGKPTSFESRESDMDGTDATGTYLGNCAEYCGTQHARMLIRVVVHPPGEFERWVAEQQRPAAEEPSAQEDKRVFFANSCVNCHTIKDTSAQGAFGPDLTHLMSRETLASGAAPNTPENLRAWVRDPQKLKVGCLMPNMQLTDQEVDRIVAYLLTLK